MTTITPRVFSTRRIVSDEQQYEEIANLIKKYGCPVSKVSDGCDLNGVFYTAVYFDVPIDSKEAFLKEEAGL